MSLDTLFGDDADDAAQASTAATQASLEISRRQAAVAEEQWAFYKTQYTKLFGDYNTFRSKIAPLEDAEIARAIEYTGTARNLERKMATEADAGVKADYEGITNLGGQASEEVSRAMEAQRGAGERTLARRGLTPLAGASEENNRVLRLDEARLRAGAITRANMVEGRERRAERKYADEETWARRGEIVRLGARPSAPGAPPVPTVSTGQDTRNSAMTGLTDVAAAQAARSRQLAQEQDSAWETVGTVAGIVLSDRRLKANIRRIGKFASGLPIYRFNYSWSDEPMIGVMADEAAALFPHAVITLSSGYQAVNYGALS